MHRDVIDAAGLWKGREDGRKKRVRKKKVSREVFLGCDVLFGGRERRKS